MKNTVYRFPVPLRIALLADLHDKPFGEIASSLSEHKPDIICVAGDTVHHVRPDGDDPVILRTANVLPFFRACAAAAPTFVSLGNHDWRLDSRDLDLISGTGVTLLDNCWCSHKGVLIGGLSSASFTAYKAFRKTKPEPYPDWSGGVHSGSTAPDTSWLEDFCRQEGCKLLLCHHPEYRDRYLSGLPIDLVLSGHAHGGQIRLFGRGLYAPGQGILPKYTSGIHGNMMISRGLANTGGIIPRLFNRREIVYIEPS